MKFYRGYYIDNCAFHSKEEIDRFVEKQAVEAHKKAYMYFIDHCSVEASTYCEQKAEYLVKQFGYTWAQIDELEIKAIEEYNRIHAVA